MLVSSIGIRQGGELALVQIDFSAAFDRVNHGGLVFKLREAGVGGLIMKVFQNFLSSRTQRVKVDGVFSSSIDVVSGVPQGSVFGGSRKKAQWKKAHRKKAH